MGGPIVTMHITNRTSVLLLNLVIMAAAVAPACSTLSSPPRTVAARAWEHESSDLPPNARIHFGKYNNGMRFAWMTNSEPKERCYVRLHINVGSLAEEESERGIAHFLEHMCFNGSKHFAPGTLVEWFQKHGMSFGADTNASTGFDQTIYQLDLPKSDAKTLEEGLGVMRDFADGLLIPTKEVDAEKGVIDAEERERDSAQFRVLVKSLALQYEGTRVGDRLPIGIKSARDKFTSDSVRKFYKKWYRPENMTLVIVGDLKDLNPETLMNGAFGDMPAPSDALAATPSVGNCKYPNKEFWIYDKELTAVSIGLTMARPWVDRPENVKTVVDDVPINFARRMLNLRFSELAKKKDAPFLSASVGDARDASSQLGIRVEEGESLNINCQPEQWDKALARCEKELRRAIEFGFDESELNEVRANSLRGLEESVEREKTRSSGAFLSDILDAAENRSVPTDAATTRNLLKPVILHLTPEICAAAFKKAWSEGTLIVGGFGGIDLGADGGKKLRDVYEESRRKEVKKREKKVEIPFAYASDPAKKGKIVSQTKNEEFDFTEVTFENKIVLRVKKTDFQKNQIVINAMIGEGALTIDSQKTLYATMTPIIYNLGGLGKHTVDELRTLNAGKQVGSQFVIGEDAFVLSGGTTSKDLNHQFDLMAAMITDPGLRDDGLQQMKKQIPLFYEQLKHNAPLALQTKWEKDMYNDETRALPALEVLQGFTVDQLKSWLLPQLDRAPMNITVVGDLEIDAVIEAAARTFGNFTERRAVNPYEAKRKPVELVLGKKFTYEVESEIPKVAIRIVYPTTDGRETTTRRHLNWVGSVLNDRLRVEVREKLGATYSPRAGSNGSRIFPNDGIISIDVESAPDKVDETIEACLAAADGFAKNGTDEDELNRVREPLLAQFRDVQRTNGFWMQNLSQMYTNPKTIDDMRTMIGFIENVKITDLGPLAKKYLTRDRATIFVSKPTKPASAPAPAK